MNESSLNALQSYYCLLYQCNELHSISVVLFLAEINAKDDLNNFKCRTIKLLMSHDDATQIDKCQTSQVYKVYCDIRTLFAAAVFLIVLLRG